MDDVFAALADPTRRLILDELIERDGQALFELATRLITRHNVSTSRQGVSHHLAVLERAGLIRVQRKGRTKQHFLRADRLAQISHRWTIQNERRADVLRINVASIYVDDQDKALDFYTTKLGFVPKNDIPAGSFRWLTVVSPSEQDGVELLLEPDEHPAVQDYKRALMRDGIPVTSFAVSDFNKAYDALVERGVNFLQAPAAMGPMMQAVLEDTCGNLVMIAGPGSDAAGSGEEASST